ncbi:MAG: two pore domain potassium channel family protein [Solirubrobacterales bacterium]|nr:two pore domain potassium channel family protein [Solirubrobacterales bacterium]
MAASKSPPRRGTQLLQRRIAKVGLRPRLAAGVILVSWVVAVLIFGVVEYLVDPDTFGNVWLGMWWAVQTVTTVGYGDVVPGQTDGKVVASFLMLGGLSFLAVVSGAITSFFLVALEQERQESGEDPVMQKLEGLSAKLDSLEAELASLDRRSDA